MIDVMGAFSNIDWNKRLDDKIDKSINDLIYLSGKTVYTITDLDSKVNADETLREYIRNTEKEFMKKRADIDDMDDAELNTYIDYLDSLWREGKYV